MDRRDRRWDLVVIGILTNMSLGTVYSWSVFREPLVAAFGFSTAETARPYSVFLALFAFSMPLGGRLQTRIGTRTTMAIGALLVAAGWISAGVVSTIGALAITYGVVGGIGVGLAYGVPLAVVGSWFPRRRGLALGLTLAGFGLSPFVTAPVAEYLIEHGGVSRAFIVLGIAFLLVLSAATVFMKRAPSVATAAASGGAAPSGDGASSNDGALSGANTGDASAGAAVDIGPRGMVRTPAFWGLWLTFGLGTFAGLTAIGMSAAYGIEVVGIGAGAAAAAVAGFGVFNGLGRPVFGWLTDHIGPRRTAIIAFLVIALGSLLALLATTAGVAAYLAGFAVLWMLLGGWLAIAPTATMAFFGPVHYPENYGIVYTAYGVGALAGGAVSGYLTSLTGTLATTYWAVLGSAAVGVGVALALLPARSRWTGN